MTSLVSNTEVSTAGFEKTPNAITFNTNLTVGARACYPFLAHLTHLGGRRREGDAVRLPPLADMAPSFGCSAETLRKYIAELKAAGWVTVTRASRTRPLLYILHESLENRVTTPVEIPRKSSDPRASAILALDKRDTLPSEVSVVGPLKLVKVDGRNLGFDALVEVTGADVDAESGKIAAGLSKIRKLYWRDLPDNVKAAMDSESFERGLAAEIRERANLYEIRYRGGVELTPTALASNWVRVTRQQPRRASDLEQWVAGKEAT